MPTNLGDGNHQELWCVLLGAQLSRKDDGASRLWSLHSPVISIDNVEQSGACEPWVALAAQRKKVH
jgi:hypothetical protein